MAATFRGNGWIEMSKSQLQKWLIHREESKPLRQANKPWRPKILFCGMTFNAFKDRLCPWTSKEIIARQQSADVEVQKITLTRWRILFVVFSAVAQTMLCLRKGQCFDTQAKNCRQNGVQCCLLCNVLQGAVKIHTTSEMRNVNITPFSFGFHLKSKGDFGEFVLQSGVSIWVPFISPAHSH